MTETKIEWTDATWNPVRGCSRVSPGCDSCYAMKMAHRFSGPDMPYEGLTRIGKRGVDWAGFARLVPEQLTVPLRWNKPRRIFVNSMSDLFHESLANEQIAAVFGIMADCPWHTFQVLTKRADRMRKWLRWVNQQGAAGPTEFCLYVAGRRTFPGSWPLPNVWLGVSAEDQQRADERIPHLLQTPAAVRFVSVEPMLGPVDLTHLDADAAGHKEWCQINALTGRQTDMGRPCFDVAARLDWVIVGGESGPKARPFDLAWARSLVEQCKSAEVACFVKQMGARSRMTQLPEWYETTGQWSCKMRLDAGAYWLDLRDRAGADPAEWPEGLRVREWPR